MAVNRRFRRFGHRQTGMSLIELMFALVILVLAMAATLPLFVIAVAGNNRSKIDTQAVLVTQMFLEEISDASKSSGNGNVVVNSCDGSQVVDGGGNPVTIAAFSCASPGGCGCPLSTAGRDIDWTKGTSSCTNGGYAYYTTCSGSSSAVTYEVRWNFQPVLTSGQLIAVSGRLKGSPAGTAAQRIPQFMIPITLHTLYGQ